MHSITNMGCYKMAHAKLRECSGGQPSYRVKVYYDGQGVCYFRDGWSKFFLDYGAHEGWFILLTHHDGKKDFTVCFFDPHPLCPYLCRPAVKDGGSVDLQRGLLRDEVHAALAPGRGRRGSPGRGILGTLRGLL
jgi:hypothetical protein